MVVLATRPRAIALGIALRFKFQFRSSVSSFGEGLVHVAGVAGRAAVFAADGAADPRALVGEPVGAGDARAALAAWKERN